MLIERKKLKSWIAIQVIWIEKLEKIQMPEESFEDKIIFT